MRNFPLSTYFSGSLSNVAIELESGGSENVLKMTSTNFLTSPQLWTFADYLRTDPYELTICDEQGGSVETLNINDNDVDLSQYANATCGFILYEDDSTANCRDLAPHCEDNRGLAVSRFPCWRLKWCPEGFNTNPNSEHSRYFASTQPPEEPPREVGWKQHIGDISARRQDECVEKGSTQLKR